MRILFWTDAFWPEIGGLEVFCGNLVRGLKARGHVCAVITNRPERTPVELLDFEGTAVHGFSFQEALQCGNIKLIARQHAACSRIADEFAPDMIHLHGISRSIFHFARAQKRQRRPTVITLHDNVLFRKPYAMATPVLRDAEVLVASSGQICRDMLDHDPTLAPRMRTIRNALPDVTLTPAPLPGNQAILSFGRLEEHKGFDLAIRAFANVAAEFPESTLTLAGDGPQRAALESLAAETTCAERIRFTGWIPAEKMNAVLNEHALVLVPSRWQEPFGLVALQAAQMGRPVIASRTGGLPEIVVDGVTGRLVENENLSAWTDSLQLLLADSVLAAKMGRAAQAHASIHFRFDHLVDAYEQAYAAAQNANR